LTRPRPRAAFTSLDQATADDYALIRAHDVRFDAGQTERLLAMLQALADAGTGLPVSRLEHCLQTATRAHQAGEAEAYVVAALMHDVGELYCPHNHAELAATLLRPYVSEELHFILLHHTLFQGYHFWHVLGGDRHARDVWRGHPAFEPTARFCERYDQVSFDPHFASMPLTAFEPMIGRVLERPRAGYNPDAVPLWRRALRGLYRAARAIAQPRADA
jgi:predicted HD phosphohydrolase